MYLIKTKPQLFTCLGVLVFLTTAFVFPSDNVIAQTASFFPNLGMSIEFPSDWGYAEPTRNSVLFIPSTGTMDGQPERVFISVMAGVSMPIPQLADATRSALLASVPDINLYASDAIMINGNTAHRYIYTYTDPTFGTTQAMDIVMTDGYNTYGITYFADPSDYQVFAPNVNRMIDSLRTSGSPIYSVEQDISDDIDASSMLDLLGDEAETSPGVAQGLRDMVEAESATNDAIIGNMN